MTIDPRERAARMWLDGPLAALGLSALLARALAIPLLGLSAEEALWAGVFGDLRRESGWCGLWARSAESYRPLCATYLEVQASLRLPVWALHAMSYGMHVACVGLLGWLAARLAGRRAGWITFALASVSSTAVEVTSWLGGRCELLWVLFALLAAHATLGSERAQGKATWAWAAAAAVAAVAAATAKESAFFLPLLVWPLVRRPRAARPPIVAITAALSIAFVVRWAVLGDALGAYAERNLFGGFSHLARQSARAAHLLVWGEAPALSEPGLAAAAVLAALGVILLVRARHSFEPHLVPWVIALAGALMPSLAKSAPRTLYAPALVLATGAALALVRRPRVAPSVLACTSLFAFAHVVGSITSLTQWMAAYGERDVAAAILVEAARERELFVVAPRETFRGRRLGRPGPAEGAAGPVRALCMRAPDPLERRDPAPGDLAVGHRVQVRDDHGCRPTLVPQGFRCPLGAMPPWIAVERGALVIDRVRQPRDARVAFVDGSGELRFIEGSCEP